MPRLWFTYLPKDGAELELDLAARTTAGEWGPVRRLEAVIDSGASYSLLRARDIDELGISPAQTLKGPTMTLAGGGRLHTRKLVVPVFAAVVHPETHVRWSPPFRLQPLFAASADRLLGMDFFGVFEVCFWPEERRVSLVY